MGAPASREQDDSLRVTQWLQTAARCGVTVSCRNTPPPSRSHVYRSTLMQGGGGHLPSSIMRSLVMKRERGPGGHGGHVTALFEQGGPSHRYRRVLHQDSYLETRCSPEDTGDYHETFISLQSPPWNQLGGLDQQRPCRRTVHQ